MTKPHNQKPADILPELAKRLMVAGLQPQMIKVIKGKLALDTKGDFLPLSPKISDQVFRTVQTKTKRETLKLVDMIAKRLKEALELEADLDDPEARPPKPPSRPSRVPRVEWTRFLPDLQPPEGRGPAPETAEEFLIYYDDFLSKNLGPLKFSDEKKRELAERAEFLKEELEVEYGLSPHEVATLMKVSFYDIFFLCDNSGSMAFGNRIDALNNTLQSVSFWATKIEPSGISLRFLYHNGDEDGRFDNLTDADLIDELIMDVELRGPTRLGTMLRKKVIRPLEERARSSGGKIKPRIIIIITDGEPSREDRDCLRDAILDVKTDGLLAEFGSAVTVFLLAKVGNDEEATLFLEELINDEDISPLLFTFKQPLDEVMDILVKESGDMAYQTLWMKLFNAALNSQTD